MWDFVSNWEAAEIVLPFLESNDCEGAATTLLKEATSRWKQHGPLVDDITCILVRISMFS